MKAIRKSCAVVGTVLIAAAMLFGAPAKHATARASRVAAAMPAAGSASLKLVDPARIRADVKFLSDDLLEGRGPGQRGGYIAAKYIAAQFEQHHLKPGGDNGTYFQKVPLVGLTTQPQSTFEIVPAAGDTVSLKYGDQITAYDETAQPESIIDAPVVFVGYGIDAPEYKWNDYKDADVRGKVVLIMVNEPPSDDPAFFNGKALTYYGRWTYKFEEAARKGAVGALVVHRTDLASYGWNVVETSNTGEKSYLRENSAPKLKLESWVQYSVGDQMAKSIGKSMDELIQMANSRDFHPVPLPLRIKAHVVTKVHPFDSYNVIGIVPGSDAKVKQQAVLYTAHWDHLGIHRDQPGDNIYNGAIDNGTGVGVLLEIARAFADNPMKPRRSLIFVSVTAEEQGLLGSEYLGEHPPIPANDISLGLNFDAVDPIGVPQEVSVTGADRMTFYPTVEQTAKEFKMGIVPDDNPGAGFYYRSDHFSLSRVGIPAFSINQGTKFEGKPAEYGKKFQADYTKNHYHQPSDEFHEDWDFAGNGRMARLGVALGWKAANWGQEVQWRSGDEFEAARKASESATGK